MSEWPVFHMSGMPPCASMSSISACEHLTSKMMVPPGWNSRMSREKRIISWSPQMMPPSSATAPMRSASPSKEMPMSAPSLLTRAIRSARGWPARSGPGNGWGSCRPGRSRARPPRSRSAARGRAPPAADAVAGVDDDLERPGQLDVAGDVVHVSRQRIGAGKLALTGGEVARLDDRPQLLDLLAVDGAVAAAELEAVVLRRVVAAGDHGAGLLAVFLQGEIEGRRRHLADVDHVHAGGERCPG